MDAQAKKKALFRAKLNAQKKNKRIDSPLVTYNESDQPVCRVCNVVLKSEALWDAHQVSRKHHEAISNLKAAAAAKTPGNNAKPEPQNVLSNSKPEHVEATQNTVPERSRESARPQSGLPPDFFDNNEKQKPNAGKNPVQVVENEVEHEKFRVPTSSFAQSKKTKPVAEPTQPSKITDSEAKQVKGALPEGFFDNKEADLRARGIKPVRLDVKDEYKEFEKLIQEDLQEVDNRMEEDEFDAAEMIEEAESAEQKIYREKLELLRKKRLELKAAKSAKRSRISEDAEEKPRRDESSSDDDSDDNFAVDWRAQHF